MLFFLCFIEGVLPNIIMTHNRHMVCIFSVGVVAAADRSVFATQNLNVATKETAKKVKRGRILNSSPKNENCAFIYSASHTSVPHTKLLSGFRRLEI